MRDGDCVAFLQWALPELRMRWAGFRKVRRQVCRRIARRLDELGLEDLGMYRLRLHDDLREWEVLDRLCRVTISRFFRDRGVFESLRDEVLPTLAARAVTEGRRTLDAWCAGCASGEEPYSLHVTWKLGLSSRFPEIDLKIVATDTDQHLLERARRAAYPAGALRELPVAWRGQAFAEDDDLFFLRPELKGKVEFRCEDLRKTAPPGPFDLVLCRNLAFTYYTEDLQKEVLVSVGMALRSRGVLVIGSQENLPAGAQDFRTLGEAPSCFERL